MVSIRISRFTLAIWLLNIGVGTATNAPSSADENTNKWSLLAQSARLLDAQQPTDANAADNTLSWITVLNDQLLLINQLTAHYAWQSTVQPTVELSRSYVAFNSMKTAWSRDRCSQARHYLASWRSQPAANITAQMHRISTVLCAGPQFNRQQTTLLSRALSAMETGFVAQTVCIPATLNLCNLPGTVELWRHTYTRNAGGQMWLLNGDSAAAAQRPITKTTHFLCLHGEPDMERIVGGDHSSLFRDVAASQCPLDPAAIAQWAWEAWRLAAGPAVWQPLRPAIALMNAGARQNGYADIGAVWRAELETEQLPARMAALWRQTQPLYRRLHAVVRNAVWRRTLGTKHAFERTGAVPAHLLASMWSQNWTPLERLLRPEAGELAEQVRGKNWTARQIVEHADDFYASLGLPRMTEEFWRDSRFERSAAGNGSCHGTAANMYAAGDVRMIFCLANGETGGGSAEDIYVAVHELGHIHYFLGFMDTQPPVFQDAHSALQEAIGDAIHLGFQAPQHRYRLGLLSDEQLTGRNQHEDAPFQRSVHGSPPQRDDCPLMADRRAAEKAPAVVVAAHKADPADGNSVDVTLLLGAALGKVAQLPFEYLLDVYRWDLFAGRVAEGQRNTHLWELMRRHQGVVPPEGWRQRAGGLFDAGAKYHVADNTPFARYFLASFLHAQIFRGLCEVMLFNRVRPGRILPMPLHRCDIYGSKRAGKLLKKAFAMGNSQPWTEVLYVLTGYREVRADALLEYYAPLDGWLDSIVAEYKIPIGW